MSRFWITYFCVVKIKEGIKGRTAYLTNTPLPSFLFVKANEKPLTIFTDFFLCSSLETSHKILTRVQRLNGSEKGTDLNCSSSVSRRYKTPFQASCFPFFSVPKYKCNHFMMSGRIYSACSLQFLDHSHL